MIDNHFVIISLSVMFTMVGEWWKLANSNVNPLVLPVLLDNEKSTEPEQCSDMFLTVYHSNKPKSSALAS